MAFYEANRRKLTKKPLSSILLNIRMIWSHVKKNIKKLSKIFGGLEKMLYFCPLERWQSGRLRRS